MEVTQHYNPVRLLMGANAVGLLGKEVRQYGSKCLLVIQNNNDAMLQLQRRITAILSKAEIEFEVFTDIRPNPLIQDIEKGIRMLQNGAFDVIVAVGGGSVIDTAKVLSISADESIDWKQCFQNPFLKPVKQKIPFIAVPTTAGTGSHCTQAAVVSDEKNIKHSIYSFDFFASEALVDYTLTMSLPVSLSASTGFDAFCHLSESYIMGHLSPIMVTINVEAMKKAITTLPKLVKENKPEYREIMSVVDSCAGICLSNGGAIIPHAFGEILSGVAYRINHGHSLAICYPPFVEHYYDHERYGQKIKEVIRLFDHGQDEVKDGKAARKIIERFIESLGMPYQLAAFDIRDDELEVMRSRMMGVKRFQVEETKEIIDDICKSAKK